MTYTDLPSWNIPLWFFFWAPVLVLAVFVVMGLMARRCGVARALEGDWNGYNTEDVRKLLTIYGEKGREIYRSTLLPADAAFAVFYGVIGALLAAGLIARGLPLWAAAACGLPWMLSGLADLLEGLKLARLFERFPAISDSDVATASFLTRIKLIFFTLGIIGAICAFVLAAKPALLLT